MLISPTLANLTWAIVVSAVANWAALETWRHGSLFAGVRARLEVRQGGFLADLLLCTFCLSHWTGALILAMVLLMAVDFSYWDWWQYAGLIGPWLVVVRLSNLLNDLTRNWCRTPNRTVPVALEDTILKRIATGSYDPTPLPTEPYSPPAVSLLTEDNQGSGSKP